MSLNTIEEIIADIQQGKMVILMDDEDRENEGDIIVAAEKVTPEIINFMASEARGLICLTLTGERCDFLAYLQWSVAAMALNMALLLRCLLKPLKALPRVFPPTTAPLPF